MDEVLDVEALRARFPALRGDTAYFDGPGGTQTPDVVGEAVAATLTGPLSNRGTLTAAERNADAAVRSAREALADLVGAEPQGVIFGRSMTALTFDLSRALAATWGPGDEVVVSRLDHDANVRPWVIAAERAGARVRWATFDPSTGELDPGQYDDLVNERTRLVAVTAASNLIGTMPDVAAIGRRAHAAGALLYVDGVHATAHELVDARALGADFYACSPYKFLGPHAGAVAGRPELLATLRPDKLRPATDDVPERFELGTLPYELMAGTAAAVDFLAAAVPGDGSRRERLRRSMGAIAAHEERLRRRVEEAIADLPEVRLHSRAARRAPTLLATFDAHSGAEVAARLAERGVNAPAGTFYAYEPARVLGLGDDDGVRIGIAPYTDDADVDRLVEGLRAALGR